jgi:H+/Cl- antiporter ClcA
MSKLEEWLIDSRTTISENILEQSEDNQFYAWLFLGGWCFAICCFASILTIKIGPGANGSGIAEIMAYLNGVNYPRLIEVRSLIIKILCVVFGIAGSLCIGKEGPLAHIGAVMA